MYYFPFSRILDGSVILFFLFLIEIWNYFSASEYSSNVILFKVIGSFVRI